MQGNVQTDALDEYNPFSGSRIQPHTTGNYPPTIPPQRTTQGDVNQELDRRQKELDARAKELERREQEYAERQKLQQSSQVTNNWPPFPSFFPCQPWFYQDFDVDFSDAVKNMAKRGYYLWMAYAIVLLLNIFGALAYFIKANNTTPDASSTFATSIILFLFLVPLTYVCWFRALYSALKKDSSFHYFVFFITFGIQVVIVIIQCLGFLWLPSCGWINSLSMLKQDTGVAIFMLVIAAMFTIVAVLDVILLMTVHHHYRTSGASFQKAKEEFGRGVIANETVRTAAYNTVTSQTSSR